MPIRPPRGGIESMIDAVCLCVKCGLSASARCKCHDPKDPVTLLCTVCGDTLVIEREDWCFDYEVVETKCPKCRPKKKATRTAKQRSAKR